MKTVVENEIKFPSIRFNYPSNLYYNLPYLSQSKLANYLYCSELTAHESFIEDTDAMRFGRAFHQYFLSRLVGEPQNVPMYAFDLRTSIGKAARLKMQQEGITDFFKSSNEMIVAGNMTQKFNRSVNKYPNQKMLVEEILQKGKCEVTVFWTDLNGRKYKSRLDIVILDIEKKSAHIVDLKTTAKEIKAGKEFYEFRSMDYDLQLFTYHTALKSLGFVDIKYTIIYMQTNGDYGFYDYLAGDEAYNSGAEKFQKALENYDSIMKKINKGEFLTSSITKDIFQLIHPALERGEF